MEPFRSYVSLLSFHSKPMSYRDRIGNSAVHAEESDSAMWSLTERYGRHWEIWPSSVDDTGDYINLRVSTTAKIWLCRVNDAEESGFFLVRMTPSSLTGVCGMNDTERLTLRYGQHREVCLCRVAAVKSWFCDIRYNQNLTLRCGQHQHHRIIKFVRLRKSSCVLQGTHETYYPRDYFTFYGIFK
jgi:hypothetical protein